MSTIHPTSTPTTPVVTVGTNKTQNQMTAIEADLRRVFSKQQAPKQVLDALLQVAVRHTQAEYVTVMQSDSSNRVRVVCSIGSLEKFKDVLSPDAFVDACRAAAERKDVITKCLSESARRFAIAAPVMAPGQPASILAALVTPGEQGVAPRIHAVDMIAGALSQWRLTEALDRLEWESRASAAATELVSAVETSDSFPAALYLVANELQRFYGCEQVVVGWKRPTGAGVDIKVVSGVAEFDPNSESMELVRSALDESIVRESLTTWPPHSASDRHATLAHRKLVEGTKHEAIVSGPLTTVKDETVGAVLLAGRRDSLHQPRRLGAIDAMRPHLSTALATRQLAEPSMLRKAYRKAFGKEGASPTRTLTMAIALPLLLVPLIPIPYKVKSDCVVEPVTRRFTVAPYDGRLKSSLVKPGNIVSAGQTLAQMDDRELRWELSRLAADRGRAAKKRDVAMAAHDTSEQQLAELERDGFDVKIRLLKYREENLDIISPIDGLVLKGDLEDAEGAPVQAGQALFEVAPLDSVKLEVAIPEEDLPQVEEGMSVTAQLEGYRASKVSGEINSIHPRSEIRNGKNVFIAEVELSNPDGELLPG